MCKRIRKLCVTLSVALLLLTVTPVSHAQVSSTRLICSVIPEASYGQVSIFPPAINVDYPNPLWWIARVHHWDADKNYAGFTYTNWLYHKPPNPNVSGVGGWSDLTTGYGVFVTSAYNLGYVMLEEYLFDAVTQQWI